MKEGEGFLKSIKSFMHDNVYINRVPSYGNTIFYSFGFILISLFILLGITGVVMAFFNKPWWLISSFGVYVRSVHMWAAQAFILFLLLHLLVTFSTSAYKKKKWVWVVGSLMFIFFVIQTEFGYALRGDFSSQWRALQGADFWNGNLLGHIINPLNYSQIFSIHVLIIPLFLVFAVLLHYGIVRKKGLSKPYRKDIKYKMVEANHNALYLRAGIVIAVILILGLLIQSPFLPRVTVKQVASENPAGFAQTLLAEYNHTSDTATYQNTVDPYTFNTREVYITKPYGKYISLTNKKDLLLNLNSESQKTQLTNFIAANDYFSKNGSLDESNQNPLISVISSLTIMAQSGLYQSELKASLPGDNSMYVDRILSDTGYMDSKAEKLGISLENYGMLKDEKGAGIFPPNSWWMFPFNLLDNTVLKNDSHQDRDGGEVIGLFILLLAALPWLPYLNKIPEKARLYRLFWKKK